MERGQENMRHIEIKEKQIAERDGRMQRDHAKDKKIKIKRASKLWNGASTSCASNRDQMNEK
jgi:hypothetical protein